VRREQSAAFGGPCLPQRIDQNRGAFIQKELVSLRRKLR